MFEKRTFLLIFIIIEEFINVYSSQLVDRCSKWNISSPIHIFGHENGTAGNDISALDLSNSNGLEILPNTDEIILLDDNNHRILVINHSNISTLFAILSNSSNSINRSTIHNSPSAISHNGNNSIYIFDNWNKKLIQIRYPLDYGENITLTDRSIFLSSSQFYNNTVLGLCVNPIDGNIFLSDTSHNKIIQYDFNSSINKTYVGNGTAGNASNLLNHQRSIVMNINRTLFVNDWNNKRIQMFSYNSENAITLPIPIRNYIGLSLYSSNILILNTNNEVYLFNLTNNQSRCILNYTNIHNARISKNGTLFLTVSNRLISFLMYSECPQEITTVMSTESMTYYSSIRPNHNQSSHSYFLPVNNCPPGKFGIHCSARDNICDLNQPCLHSGSCILNSSNRYGYDCRCSEGFQGIHCEDDQRPCKLLTCFQRGICISKSKTSYKCHCHPEYEGEQCENKVNFCSNVTCQNHGVCSSQGLNYTCNCLTGFYGRYCETSENSRVVNTYVRKSFGYVAIIILLSVVGFIVLMDALKYVFGIDPVKENREVLKKKKKKIERSKVVYRFEYIN